MPVGVTRPAPELVAAGAPAAPATQRLERLCDPGSLRLLRGGVAPRHGAERDGAGAGDGVAAGIGAVDGRPVACYSQDPTFMGGSLGGAHAETICELLHLAGRSGVPVVGFVESGGARLQEGHDALSGYGEIFRASVELGDRVPQISVVTGVSAGGGAYSPALTDLIVMSEGARMFLTGPRVVGEAMGEWVSMDELGGTGVHSRNGVCDLVVADEGAAIGSARAILGYLPSRIGSAPEPAVPIGPDPGDPAAVVPAEARRVYDVAEVAGRIFDQGSILELGRRWGGSMSCGFARLEGRPVGVVANQPKRLGGVIDAAAAEKAAGFVGLCDRFGLPLVVLVDTPGFMPGTKQEGAGVIRHGASLLRAFAAARVPKVTVILRKAYGGAVITMNSKGLGADLVYAWPGAEIGIMAAGQAVGVVHRRRLAEAGDEAPALRERLADAYAGEHLTAGAAARGGFVDAVIEPRDTRACLAQALALRDAGTVPQTAGTHA
jgi:acetyl-CoA carboxylase carboxyltransferase component